MITLEIRPSERVKSTVYETYPLNDMPFSGLRFTMRPHIWRPPTDFFETEEKYVIRVEIAGMDTGDFSIVIDKNTVKISGNRGGADEPRYYHQMEIHYGDFYTEVEIPGFFSTDNVSADYQNGFLDVAFQKAEPKKIKIKTE